VRADAFLRASLPSELHARQRGMPEALDDEAQNTPLEETTEAVVLPLWRLGSAEGVDYQRQDKPSGAYIATWRRWWAKQ